MESIRKQRIIVLDCSPLTRLGVVNLLNSQEHLTVCADTHDATVARRCMCEEQPDLVVLDLELQRGDGLELLRELPALAPGSRAIVVTGQEDSVTLQRAFRTGARAFMSKLDEPRELLQAVESVSNGDLFASRRIAHLVLQFVASGQLTSREGGVSKLSNRELQVFRLLGKGIGVKSIASELGLSIRTVETHQARIKKKLTIRTCAELQKHATKWQAHR